MKFMFFIPPSLKEELTEKVLMWSRADQRFSKFENNEVVFEFKGMKYSLDFNNNLKLSL